MFPAKETLLFYIYKKRIDIEHHICYDMYVIIKLSVICDGACKEINEVVI